MRQGRLRGGVAVSRTHTLTKDRGPLRDPQPQRLRRRSLAPTRHAPACPQQVRARPRTSRVVALRWRRRPHFLFPEQGSDSRGHPVPGATKDCCFLRLLLQPHLPPPHCRPTLTTTLVLSPPPQICPCLVTTGSCRTDPPRARTFRTTRLRARRSREAAARLGRARVRLQSLPPQVPLSSLVPQSPPAPCHSRCPCELF